VENGPMADSAPPAALPEAEQRAAEALLTRALGEPAVVQAAESLWDRGHVFRLRLASGRTVIRKRRQWPIGAQLFGDELAALDYLNGMPVPVAPACSAPMRPPRPGDEAGPRWRDAVQRGKGPS
jgi:hypothetical protein